MKPTVVIMSGVPGVGKTTKAKEIVRGFELINSKAIYISRDEIRFKYLETLGGDYFEYEDQVVKEFINTINEAIVREYEFIIVDATHNNKSGRKKLISQLKGDFMLIGVNVEKSEAEILAQNDLREGRARVPHSIIRRMISQREPISAEEDSRYIQIRNI